MTSRLLVAFAAVALAAVTVAAQRPAYKVPRTPDGQPDLQGFWSNATYTPLEHPDNVTKEFYTPEEAAAGLAHHRLVLFDGVGVLVESGHVSLFSAAAPGGFPRGSGGSERETRADQPLRARRPQA